MEPRDQIVISPFNAEDSVSRHILEIGAGTGTFTEEIIKKLKLSDHLDIVELDPDLCKILRERFSHHPNVTIHEISILDFSPSNQYDFVVSGLPLNIFPSTFVEKVLEKYTDLTKQKGTLSYFEYMAIGKIKRAGLNFFGRGQDFSLVLTKKEEFKRKAKAVTVDTVLLNLTPARVIHCVL